MVAAAVAAAAEAAAAVAAPEAASTSFKLIEPEFCGAGIERNLWRDQPVPHALQFSRRLRLRRQRLLVEAVPERQGKESSARR